ncbi:MAG: mechanosensitive ion channel domain-containing protein [Solirubrobacteraceae bacterium]
MKARAVSAGRYARTAVQVGQRIRDAGLAGEVEAVESTATLLRTESGELVRLPNNMLLEHPVFVEEGSDGK